MTRKKLFIPGAFALMLVLALPAAASAQVGGKVYFSEQPVKDVSYAAVAREFGKKKPEADLTRTKDKEWKATIVAFFSKKSVPGPITVWIFDKSDPASIKANEPVAVQSVDQAGSGKHFVHDLVLDENDGYNKNRTYIIRVGQILGGKPKVYAAGLVNLKP